MDEEHSKAEGRGEMSETELLIMDQFTILVRDLYAFYPLLIRFVDYNRYEMTVRIPVYILSAFQSQVFMYWLSFLTRDWLELIRQCILSSPFNDFMLFTNTTACKVQQWYTSVQGDLFLIWLFLRLPWLNDRARWLKESNPEAEELFRMAAEIFIFWAKSHVSKCLS